MGDAAADLARAIEHAVGELVGGVAGADARWIALGVVLHLSNQLARGCGWHAVIRLAGCDPSARRREAVRAWVAGAGAGGMLSARGGDAVRLLLLRPRMPGTGVGVLAGTLVAEAAGEAAVGAALVMVAIAGGLWHGVELPAPALLAAATLGVVAIAFAVRRTAAAREIARGACALRAPGRYACQVLPWQIASRVARAAAIGCFLVAFALPVSVAAILVVMVAQGGGRLIPLAPAGVGAGTAILISSFAAVTGASADPAVLAAFYVGTSALLTAIGAAIAVVIAIAAVGPAAVARAFRSVLASRPTRLAR